MDTLHSQGDFTKDAHFETCITEFLTLQISHLQSEGPHQVVVEQGGRGGGEVRGHQAGERSSFDAENIFFFLVAVFVTHCWFMGFCFHFY